MPYEGLQLQLDALARRLESVESNQVVVGTQTDRIEFNQTAIKAQASRIESNTSELIETFNALKGAWKVLDFLGKLAKPFSLIIGIGGAWWWIKDHMKDILK